MATTKKATKPAAAKKAAAPATEATTVARSNRREITGVVVSDKMQKTIVVKVDRRVRHSLYGKYVTLSRRFKAHDENNTAKIGDQVMLVESRPMSRDKRWVLQSVMRKATQTADANV